MTRRYRLALVLQQAVGWASFTTTMRAALANDAELDVTWIPITYAPQLEWVERVPMLSERHRGGLRAAAVIASNLRGRRYDAILFNATWLAVMARPWKARSVTAIFTDVTPRQYDREARHYPGQVADRAGVVAAIKHYVNRSVLQSTSLLFPISDWTRRSMAEEYGVDPGRMHVVPFSVDVELWRPRAATRSTLPQILFVGGDFRRKGGDLLVEWFRDRGRGRCELRLVTADPEAVALREPGLTVYSDLGPNSADLRKLFWSSDVLCLPSRSEAFGIAAVEGHAAGLPVVTSDTGGLAEIVDHGRTGFRVPAGDGRALGAALDRLIGSASLRHEMGANARRRAESRFDAQFNYGSMMQLLKRQADLRLAEGPRAEAADRAAVDLDSARRVL